MDTTIRQHPCVLLIEDDPHDVYLLRSVAGRLPEPVSVFTVSDGEEGISYLSGTGKYADRQKHPFPDLVLLDLNLPTIDGFGVLKWIRSRPEFNTLRVFLWSTSDFAGFDEIVRRAGGNRYQTKPRTLTELEEFVSSIGEMLKTVPVGAKE
jgi:CheY-like chemotaxis protein